MKIIFTILIGFVFSTTVNAQFQKNDLLLTGQVNLSNNKSSSLVVNNINTTFGTGFNLSASRFISNRRYNSLILSFSHSVGKEKYGVNNESKRVTNSAGLAFGHTLLTPLAERFYLSFPFSIGTSVSSTKSTVNGQITMNGKNTAIGASATIGFLYQTKKRWVFTATLGSLAGISYNKGETKNYFTTVSGPGMTDSKSNSFTISGGPIGTAFNNLTIGIGYLIK